MAHRLAWLFPPVVLFVFACLAEGWRMLDLNNPASMFGGLAMFAYFVGHAWTLAREALRRKHL